MDSVDKVTQSFLNNEVQLFAFRLKENGHYYAVNIYKVREVIKYMGHITLVNNNTNSMLEGLITVRDETLPLIDMKKWFSYEPAFPEKDLSDEGIEDDDVLVMICDFSDFIVGVRIYEADRIVTRSWEQINQNSDAGVKSQNNKTTANTKYADGEIMQIVDVEKMLVEVFPWLDEMKHDELEEVEEIDIKDKLVLLAEDSPSAMKMMRMILRKTGVEFRDFVNGQLLLNFLFSENTDPHDVGLIITDLEMPEASGFEVIKQVRGNKAYNHIPIVVNSSMSGDSNKNMAKKLNADGFVSKSNPKEIEQVMKELLEHPPVEAQE